MKKSLNILLLSLVTSSLNAMQSAPDYQGQYQYINTIAAVIDNLDKVSSAKEIREQLESLDLAPKLWEKYGLPTLARASSTTIVAEEELRKCIRDKATAQALKLAKIRYESAFCNQVLIQRFDSKHNK